MKVLFKKSFIKTRFNVFFLNFFRRLLVQTLSGHCENNVDLFILFIYLLTEHLHLQRNTTAGQQGTNK